MKCTISFLVFSLSLTFEMKRFAFEWGVFQKVMAHKLCQNANFDNGSTTIQIRVLHVLLNILSISLLSMAHGAFCYFKMQKD